MTRQWGKQSSADLFEYGLQYFGELSLHPIFSLKQLANQMLRLVTKMCIQFSNVNRHSSIHIRKLVAHFLNTLIPSTCAIS